MSHSANAAWQHRLELLLTDNPLINLGRKGLFAGLSSGFGHVRETGGIRYGTAPGQSLDLYFPAGREPLAALAFIHGGSWRTGDKRDYRFVGRALAQRGYAVAVIGYRLYPQVYFPEFVHDVAQACIHLHTHNARLGWPELPLWLCGHSAGAHLAMLVGLEPAFSAPLPGALPPVAGVIGISGSYTFRPERDPLLMSIFGPRGHKQWWVPMCPIECVGSNKPPLLLIHGTQDTLIGFNGAQRMHDHAQAAGQSVRLERLEGLGHYQPVFAFHPAIPGHAHLMGLLDGFCLGNVT